MLDWVIQLDQQVFIFLNRLGHPYLDTFMTLLSNKYIWFPLYAYLIFRLYQKFGSSFYQPLIALILVIVIADQVTSGFMKPFFERLRPCHDEKIAYLTTVVHGCGGKFGFASSHAANTFGLAAFFYFIEKSTLSKGMLIWAALVSYSRIHLGVHYPGDIIVGGLVGVGGAYLMKTLLFKLRPDLITS